MIEHLLINPYFISIKKEKRTVDIGFKYKYVRNILNNYIQKEIEIGVHESLLNKVKQIISKTDYNLKSENVNHLSKGYFDLELEYNNKEND